MKLPPTPSTPRGHPPTGLPPLLPPATTTTSSHAPAQPTHRVRKNLNTRNLRPTSFPLIRELLAIADLRISSSDEDPSAWLGSAEAARVFARHLPRSYERVVCEGRAVLSARGELVVWGDEKRAAWDSCVVVSGLPWASVGTDVADVFEEHDIVQPPLVLGTETDHTVLVFLPDPCAVRAVVEDLDGAQIEQTRILRVVPATPEDLGRALLLQEACADTPSSSSVSSST